MKTRITLLVAFLLLGTGCLGKKLWQPEIMGDGVYAAEAFDGGRLVTATPQRIWDEWKARGGNPRRRVIAFYDYKTRTMWVPMDGTDIHGKPRPSLSSLGHETLHHIRGDWHK